MQSQANSITYERKFLSFCFQQSKGINVLLANLHSSVKSEYWYRTNNTNIFFIEFQSRKLRECMCNQLHWFLVAFSYSQLMKQQDYLHLREQRDPLEHILKVGARNIICSGLKGHVYNF